MRLVFLLVAALGLTLITMWFIGWFIATLVLFGDGNWWGAFGALALLVFSIYVLIGVAVRKNEERDAQAETQ